MRIGAASIALCLIALSCIPVRSQPVDLELVLAVDVSTSVDDAEFELQKQGLAEAFLHPEVIRAIRIAGERGVAISLVYWAGRFQQEIAVEWTLVNNEASAARFAEKISATRRTFAGLTGTSGIIRFSADHLLSNQYRGNRMTIDISGDGTGDHKQTAMFRDLALATGITINGLVIYSDDHDLGTLAHTTLRDFYAKNVIGGQGAFLMSADDFEDFRTAIRRKLIREIIGVFAAEAQ